VVLREEEDELVGKDHPLDRRHGQESALHQNQPLEEKYENQEKERNFGIFMNHQASLSHHPFFDGRLRRR
jgi:hypothetical protein